MLIGYFNLLFNVKIENNCFDIELKKWDTILCFPVYINKEKEKYWIVLSFIFFIFYIFQYYFPSLVKFLKRFLFKSHVTFICHLFYVKILS